MKRLLALALCAVMMIILATGCSKKSDDAYNDMMALLGDMAKFSEGEFNIGLSVNGFDDSGQEAVQDLASYNIQGLRLYGPISTEKHLAQISLDIEDSKGSAVELTDIIVIGDDTYINLEKAIDGVMLIADPDDDETMLAAEYFDVLLADNEYMYSIIDGLWTAQKESVPLSESKLSSDYFAVVKEKDAVTYKDNAYTISLTGKDLEGILVNLATDMKENAGSYADYFSDILDSSAYGDPTGLLPFDDDLEATISNYGDAMLSGIDDADLSELTLTQVISFDKATDTYSMDTSVNFNDEFSFDFDISLTNKEIGSITAPSSYITSEQLMENLTNLLSGVDPQDIFNGEDSTTQEPPTYAIIKSSEISSFLNPVLSGYTSLETFDFDGTSGGKYSVPRMAVPNYGFSNGTLSSESDGMMQYFMAYTGENYTAKEFLQWYIEDDYSYEYRNPGISDIIVSEDESIAAGAFSYDDSYYGRISMVYVAVIVNNGEDILLMNIDVYHDLMEDSDYVILSELSNLMKFSITDLYAASSTSGNMAINLMQY